MSNQSRIYGRLFIYDTGDPPDLSFWQHELLDLDDPSDYQCVEDWAREYFWNALSEEDLRNMFSLPATGNYQVLFEGDMKSQICTTDGIEEQDEWFEVSNHWSREIPKEWMDDLEEIKASPIE